ncbi:MAG: hypothetical protein AAF228_08545 [Pseudomonadota bacterium]
MQEILRQHFKKEFEKSSKSQKACAEFANINKAKLSLSLNGKRAFQLDEIGPISRYLGCGLPQELLIELNAAASLQVPVIGLVEPDVVRPVLSKGSFEKVHVPYVPMQTIANLDQYAQQLVLNNRQEAFFSGKYFLSCVDYHSARHGFFDDGDIAVGLRRREHGYEKGIWRISVMSQKPYANQLFVDEDEMVKLDPYANCEIGELEILDLILAIFVSAE